MSNRPAVRQLARPLSMWIGVVGISVLYVGSMVPTALYPLYEHVFGFSELMVTAIYASYAIGNIAALFFFGRLSDQLGRRPASLIAFGILFAGRVLNGLGVGLGAR